MKKRVIGGLDMAAPAQLKKIFVYSVFRTLNSLNSKSYFIAIKKIREMHISYLQESETHCGLNNSVCNFTTVSILLYKSHNVYGSCYMCYGQLAEACIILLTQCSNYRTFFKLNCISNLSSEKNKIP